MIDADSFRDSDLSCSSDFQNDEADAFCDFKFATVNVMELTCATQRILTVYNSLQSKSQRVGKHTSFR